MKAYLYIKSLIDSVLELESYDLVFTGDSAGGNICLALLNWVIMNGLPRPQGLLLCYPACNLALDMFSTSHLHCLHDHLLSFSSLSFFFKCYLDASCDPEKDFMIR